jgi:serine/threonine protein phosphatase PrpC
MAAKGLTLVMVARTDVGHERNINEDNFLVSADYRSPDWFLPSEPYTATDSIMVVADGMGGLNAGEVASRITVDSIKEFLRNYGKPPTTDEAVRTMLDKAILFAHKKVVAHSSEHAETTGMGSTIVVGLIANQKIHFVWSGDSRGYVYRQGKLQQLTTDHSYVQSLVDEGKLTPEQAFLHPDSNVILQSVGDVDRSPRPDYVSLPLCNDDIIVLCSDGVNSMLPDLEIQNMITSCPTNLAQCAEKIVAAANDAGGVDNITILLSKVMSGAAKPPPPDSTDATTLNPFAKNTLPNKKRRGKGNNRWGILLAVLVLLTTAFFVAPMFNKHAEPAAKPATPAKKDSSAKKDSLPKKDSIINHQHPVKDHTPAEKKPSTAPPKPPTTTQAENELTPVVDTTKK